MAEKPAQEVLRASAVCTGSFVDSLVVDCAAHARGLVTVRYTRHGAGGVLRLRPLYSSDAGVTWFPAAVAAAAAGAAGIVGTTALYGAEYTWASASAAQEFFAFEVVLTGADRFKVQALDSVDVGGLLAMEYRGQFL